MESFFRKKKSQLERQMHALQRQQEASAEAKRLLSELDANAEEDTVRVGEAVAEARRRLNEM